MKCLVLGSAGLIGRHLCLALREHRQEVIEFDIKNDPEQDLRRASAADPFLARADFVYFLACDVGGSKYLSRLESSFAFINNNVGLLLHAFEALRRHGKPFIFVSSQMASLQRSSYGIIKSIGELYTRALGGLVVRLWNVYGPETFGECSHVITDFVNMAKSGCINMRTNGEEMRQFLHVEDCVAALLEVSARYNTLSRDVNIHISSFTWNTIRVVAEIVRRHIPCKVNLGKLPDSVQSNSKFEPDPFVLSFWKPRISLEDGIAALIDFQGR